MRLITPQLDARSATLRLTYQMVGYVTDIRVAIRLSIVVECVIIEASQRTLLGLNEESIMKDVDYEVLLKTWEPKIHRFLNSTYIVGMAREDLAQELSIAIWKAAENFDPDRKVSFHTYLHTIMVNSLRTLISKAQRSLHFHDALSLEKVTLPDTTSDNQTSFSMMKITKALEDKSDMSLKEELELEDLLVQCGLTDQEKLFVDVRIQGFTMEQITTIMEESAYKIRARVQKKVKPYFVGAAELEQLCQLTEDDIQDV